MTTNNVNVKMPPMLPTMPLPLNVVTSNVMYMYSCSQCEFKTHIESLFKQHVDSVHLGIPNVPNNMVLGQNSQTTAAATAAQVAAVQAAAAAAASTSVVTSPIPSVTATLPSVISVTQPSQTFVMASGGQLVATGGHLTPANIMTQGGSVTSAVDKLHKCPKCNVLLPSKNQLTQHKRKVHGKVAMAAATGGAIPSSHGSAITYAVVSSPQQPTTVQPSSSVVASLVSQVSQPVSVLAAAAAAAQAAAAASASALARGQVAGGQAARRASRRHSRRHSLRQSRRHSRWLPLRHPSLRPLLLEPRPLPPANHKAGTGLVLIMPNQIISKETNP